MWAHQPSPESFQQFWVLEVTARIAKSTTTPTHMTTSPVRSHRPNQAISHPYTVRLTKRFHSPHRKPPGKAAQTEQQTSPMSRAATPQSQRGAGEPPQGFQVRQENRSPEVQCAQYLLEVPVWPIIPTRVSPTSRPTPRRGRNSEATQKVALVVVMIC